MPLLYYWRYDNYVRDLARGAAYHLNQRAAGLHRIGIGDSLWAFTRRPDKRYALAAELRVRARTMNAPGYRYGPYRVWGRLEDSRYFDVSEGRDAEPLVRSLSVAPKSDVLGRSFQGPGAVRELTAGDHASLSAFAKDLPLEPRARLIDELALEQATALSAEAVQELLSQYPEGPDRDRRLELIREVATRSRALVRRLNAMYSGHCQLCGTIPGMSFGRTVAEAHHLVWLSRGGDDQLGNMALLCPTDHRAVHARDAVFDFADHAFVFNGERRRLSINEHLG